MGPWDLEQASRWMAGWAAARPLGASGLLAGLQADGGLALGGERPGGRQSLRGGQILLAYHSNKQLIKH